METKKRPTPKSVDDYIASFPPEVQKVLQEVRGSIARAVPEAQEKISYGIPAFAVKDKVFTYFAAFKDHVSVYPAPRGVKEFKEALAAYRGGKGTVQLPLDVALPAELIERIAKFRASEKLGGLVAKARAKAKARTRGKAKTRAKSKTKAKAKTRARASTKSRAQSKSRAKKKTRSR